MQQQLKSGPPGQAPLNQASGFSTRATVHCFSHRCPRCSLSTPQHTSGAPSTIACANRAPPALDGHDRRSRGAHQCPSASACRIAGVDVPGSTSETGPDWCQRAALAQSRSWMAPTVSSSSWSRPSKSVLDAGNGWVFLEYSQPARGAMGPAWPLWLRRLSLMRLCPTPSWLRELPCQGARLLAVDGRRCFLPWLRSFGHWQSQ